MTVNEAGLPARRRTMRVPRSRGAVSGFLLILLGAWGALIPFIGPYFDYSYGTDQTWHWSAARGWLEVLPGAATALGGLLLLVSAHRLMGAVGGWLAALGGAWYVVGLTLAPLLHLGSVGQPLSHHQGGQVAAQLGYFYGLGAVILFLAAFALGRMAVVGVRDVLVAERDAARAAEAARAEEELSRQQALERDAAAGTAGSRVAGDRVAGDRVAGDRVAEERVAEERVAEDRLAGDRVAGERVAGDRVAGDRVAEDRVAEDRVAEDRVAEDRLRADRARAGEPVTGRYEPDRPYGSVNTQDEPTTRYNPDGVGSDYGVQDRGAQYEGSQYEGSQYGSSGRPPAHQAPTE